ncbi:glycosyltransferase [Metapseudomonas furukawaii]|uniref:Alpha-1,3-rhamnosyltransferase n=1 Tax=Metapseudomonas furukawaii TaxID=1149133 RepID=A0AAD1C3S8_METFU|nr:glycosyltransferase [Pseudomonas furukawaii]ELS27046.1 alpha-1,3-rhamnosyltransferase [Pseudomonas furukawaii]BAU76939.1 alpha-1,3-rhamnosyltransferase [Pseudomonas furukawaii]
MTDSKDLPLVSVIISSYNHADYIEACIESVMAQTYPNVELLVVDDGSRDDSVERIRALQVKYGFDFRAQENRGLSRTLNETIARSKGSLIAPFGSDDIMVPERLAIQVAYLADKPEVGICGGNVESIDANGQVRSKQKLRPARRLEFDDIFLDRKPGAPAPTMLFRREAIDAVGGYDPEIRLEDLLMKLKITRAGYVIDVLEDVLAQYRTHEHNTYKNLGFMIEHVMKTYAIFKDHPAYEEVCARFINSMLMKCARDDKPLARQLFARLPWRYWNGKTLRAVGRFLLPRRTAGN